MTHKYENIIKGFVKKLESAQVLDQELLEWGVYVDFTLISKHKYIYIVYAVYPNKSVIYEHLYNFKPETLGCSARRFGKNTAKTLEKRLLSSVGAPLCITKLKKHTYN